MLGWFEQHIAAGADTSYGYFTRRQDRQTDRQAGRQAGRRDILAEVAVNPGISDILAEHDRFEARPLRMTGRLSPPRPT